jgi:hypothetical protein
MSRRRTLVPLLLVALAGCGNSGEEQARSCSKDVDGAEGTRLTYRATKEDGRPPGPQRLAVTADKLCRRLDRKGVAISTSGDRITVVTPGRVPDGLAAPGRLTFHDWEPNLLDEKCRAHPGEINGGQLPIVGRAKAVEQVEKCEPGAQLVRQQRLDPVSPKPDAWWVMKGDPALTNDDVVNPRHAADGQTNEPIVTMEFTAAGKQRFAELTRAVARRGAESADTSSNPTVSSHHFAIVLDGELVSTPFINYEELPDGIDGEDGAQLSGGFAEQETRDLARMLDIGPLPLRLERG